MKDFIDFPPKADPFIAEKWNRLLRQAKFFAFIPFIEIVFVAGSMAMGSADENSDFDLIVGVKSGRIFTARFFCWFIFGIFGWRRTASAEALAKADKFCFSHFVTPGSYCLAEPRNEYWKKLYASLVPIYGDKDMIQKFYDANADWIGSARHREDEIPSLRSGQAPQSLSQRLPRSVQSLAMTERRQVKSVVEKMLSGKLGVVLEKYLKKIQIKKIEKSLKTVKQYKPRIIFNDSELEFHPDTKRIEEYCSQKNGF
ncbi:MAG: hypothetical protein Q7S81_03390 [bacterium]|nr:hypothetical protein [bacterium]